MCEKGGDKLEKDEWMDSPFINRVGKSPANKPVTPLLKFNMSKSLSETFFDGLFLWENIK